jgi:radical SAM protein with 4Fe4S-binding SPASM domain
MKEKRQDGNAAVLGEENVPVPYIENPVVDTGHNSSAWIGGEATKEPVSGFTPVPEKKTEYDYGDYCHHWFGNIQPPSPITYYAQFYAMVSGATHIKVQAQDGTTIVEEPLKLSEELERTPTMKLTREGTPFSYTQLRFVASNDAGMAAYVDWPAATQSPASPPPSQTAASGQWPHPLKRLSWSLTNRCNLHCRHCAPFDIHKDLVELDEAKIRNVVGDIIEMGVSSVSLSGGEVLLHPAWHETATMLAKAGVCVSLITNGTLIDGLTAEKIKGAGISRVAVSIDGLEGNDAIRGEGHYQKAALGVQKLKSVSLFVSIVTTVHALNVHMLEAMRQAFTGLGADLWGLKPLLPHGEARRNPELWLAAGDINKVIAFCHSAIGTPGIPIAPAPAFEMHSQKGAAILRYLHGENAHTDFYGDDAGIFSAQIHPDGGMVGICMDSPEHAAGNVGERSIGDIWRDKDSFKALRAFDPAKLEGYCQQCERRDTCRGGDLNMRLAAGGLYAENPYCAFRNFKLYQMET